MKRKTKEQLDRRGWQVAYQMVGGGIKLKKEFLLKLKDNPRIHRKIKTAVLYYLHVQSVLDKTSKKEDWW